MCFGCSKQPSQLDGSFEYPQHIFWLRNKKNNFQLHTYLGACIWETDRGIHDHCVIYKCQTIRVCDCYLSIKVYYIIYFDRVPTVREKSVKNEKIQGQGKLREFLYESGKFDILEKVREMSGNFITATCHSFEC